jgi:hypothetical protein
MTLSCWIASAGAKREGVSAYLVDYEKVLRKPSI